MNKNSDKKIRFVAATAISLLCCMLLGDSSAEVAQSKLEKKLDSIGLNLFFLRFLCFFEAASSFLIKNLR